MYIYSCIFQFICNLLFWVLSFRFIFSLFHIREQIYCLEAPTEHSSLLSDLLDSLFSWVYVFMRIIMDNVKLYIWNDEIDFL